MVDDARVERPLRVAVCGGGVPGPDDALAEEVGRELARRGAVLITGGREGVMEAASRGAAQAGGLTIGLLDISKPRGDIFLDRIAEKLTGQGLEVRRFQKPTYTRVAPADLNYRLAEACDLVIEALAD